MLFALIPKIRKAITHRHLLINLHAAYSIDHIRYDLPHHDNILAGNMQIDHRA